MLSLPADADSGHARSPSISLAEKAYNLLLERLMTRKLAPGMLLNRRELAAELKMSVAPVLEAIVQLQAEGFVESIARKGTLVRPVDFESLRGQLLLREALECQAARLYCGEPISKATHLAALAAAADAGEKQSFVQLWRAEFAFHSALMGLTGCAPLIEAYRGVMQRKLFASINLFLAGEAFAGGDHTALIRGLRTEDPDKAEHLIRVHLRFNKDRLFAAIKAWPA